MSDTELPERSLFAQVDPPSESDDVEEPMTDEDKEMILDLLDERDELRREIEELKEMNMCKMMAILALTTFYTCVVISVTSIMNNPEL